MHSLTGLTSKQRIYAYTPGEYGAKEHGAYSIRLKRAVINRGQPTQNLVESGSCVDATTGAEDFALFLERTRRSLMK